MTSPQIGGDNYIVSGFRKFPSERFEKFPSERFEKFSIERQTTIASKSGTQTIHEQRETKALPTAHSTMTMSATDAGGAMESDHEATSDCPYCGAPGSAVDLDCSKCMTVIPYCIVTGMRMKVGDWTKCPKCEFPATQSAMLAHVQTSGTCPMCQSSLSAADVAPIDPL